MEKGYSVLMKDRVLYLKDKLSRLITRVEMKKTQMTFHSFSWKTWVYFLREKSMVFEVFKRFRMLVEKETEKPIKVIHFDSGHEFTSRDSMKCYKEHDI